MDKRKRTRGNPPLDPIKHKMSSKMVNKTPKLAPIVPGDHCLTKRSTNSVSNSSGVLRSQSSGGLANTPTKDSSLIFSPMMSPDASSRPYSCDTPATGGATGQSQGQGQLGTLSSSSASASSAPGSRSGTAADAGADAVPVPVPALPRPRSVSVVAAVIDTPFTDVFAFKEADCRFPLKMLYKDYLYTTPRTELHMPGWYLPDAAFDAIATHSKVVRSICMDNCKFNAGMLDKLRGLPRLQSFSMAGVCDLDTDAVRVFASWPSLTELNISDNRVDVSVFRFLSQNLKRLKSLRVCRCRGLNDFCLQELAHAITRFRFLRELDFTECADFTDEGVLMLLNAGPNVLTSLNFHRCKCITSLSIAGLRKRMSVLEKLDVSQITLTQSAFEWIGEGCRMLRVLDCTRCGDLDDVSMPIIGARCPCLEELNVSKCAKITDIGFCGFFNSFEGKGLRKLNLNDCIKCTDPSMIALSQRCAAVLEVLRMNGLSQVTAAAVNAVWAACRKLTRFEMSCELKCTSSHRRSLVPHMTDAVLKGNAYSTLTHICLVGASLVTDIGAVAVMRKCRQLVHVDFSYCNDISDKFVLSVAALGKCVTALLLGGCVKVTNVGVVALSEGICAKHITRLELNGCTKVTDDGVYAIAHNMRQVEHLGLRACDFITEESLIELAAECWSLRSLDISSLDLVGIRAVSFIARRHKFLTALQCQSCNLSTYEFNAALKDIMPLAMPVPRSCHLMLRPRIVREFNTYVLTVRNHSIFIKRIQKLFLGNQFNVWTRLYHDNRRQAATRIQSAYRSVVCWRKFTELKRKLLLRFRAAKRLQRCMRRLVAVHNAMKKAKHLRRHRNARHLIQRVFRGHRVRKRVLWRFRRLWSFYRKLGHLAHKLRVLTDARRLHRRIVKVQSIARMFLQWLRYINTIMGFTMLQNAVRDWLFRRKVAVMHMSDMLDTVETRVNAAVKIGRNWKSRRFNAMVIPFTLYCANEWLRLAIEDDWFAGCIQRRFRGWVCRRELNKPTMIFLAAARIQARARGLVQRLRYPKYRKWLKGVIRRWWRMWNSVPLLAKGVYCKRIQRKFRRFRFMQTRHDAAVSVQRRYRLYFAHTIWAAIVLEKRIAGSYVITQCIRIVQCRNRRRAQHRRDHMAAWRIQLQARKGLNIAGRKRIKHATAVRQRREDLAAKKAMATARRMKAVEKIRQRWRVVNVLRIQKRWQKFAKEKRKRAEVMHNRKMLKKEVGQELTDIKQHRKVNRGGSMFDPMVLAGRAAATVSKFISGVDEIVNVKDRVRCLNSVLQHQALSLEQEGLVGLHITVGETETHTFYKQQLVLRNDGNPHYVRVERDLSATMELLIYLWVLHGSGKKTICELTVDEKPRASKVYLKERADRLRGECTIVAWHIHCHVEVRGIKSIEAGRGGFPIREVEVAHTVEQEEELRMREFELVKDLRVLGLPSAVYALQRKPITDNNVFEMKTLDMFDWTDKRLIRTIQTFNLTVEDVLNFRWAFEEILPADNKIANIVTIEVLFAKWKLEMTQIAQWIVETVHAQDPKKLLFSEYVALMCAIGLLSNKELGRFVFGCYDTENKCLLKKDQFEELIQIHLEASDRSPTLFFSQYDNYYDNQLKGVLFTSFEKFLAANPIMLWGIQNIQITFREHNLGDAWWFRKLEQFRLVRKELGIKQLK